MGSLRRMKQNHCRILKTKETSEALRVARPGSALVSQMHLAQAHHSPWDTQSQHKCSGGFRSPAAGVPDRFPVLKVEVWEGHSHGSHGHLVQSWSWVSCDIKRSFWAFYFWWTIYNCELCISLESSNLITLWLLKLQHKWRLFVPRCQTTVWKAMKATSAGQGTTASCASPNCPSILVLDLAAYNTRTHTQEVTPGPTSQLHLLLYAHHILHFIVQWSFSIHWISQILSNLRMLAHVGSFACTVLSFSFHTVASFTHFIPQWTYHHLCEILESSHLN